MFSWTEGRNASDYWLDVGNSIGQGDLPAGVVPTTSRTVSGLPCDGRTLFVRLWTRIAGVWQSPLDYTFRAAHNCGVENRARILSPEINSRLPGPDATFTWSSGTGVSEYWLDIGNGPGSGDIFARATTATAATITRLPTDGRTVFARLWSRIGGTWQTPLDYIFRAASRAALISPSPGSTLPGGTVTFTWTSAGNINAFWLDVGRSQGVGNYFAANVGTTQSRTVSGLPTDGSTVFVRLWTQFGSVWHYHDYRFTASR